MKNLNHLSNLVRKLNPEEMNSVKKYLSGNNVIKNGNGISPSLKLLELISGGREIHSEKIQSEIYGQKNSFAFNKLVDRMKEKILEVLMIHSNSINNSYTDRVKTIFALKKKLIHCEILSLKGLRDDCDLLCRKIIAKAEAFELFDIVISALMIRQRFIVLRGRNKEIQSIQEEILLAENKNQSLVRSQNIFNKTVNKINSSSEPASYLDELAESIRVLEKEYESYRLDLVNYFLLFLKTEQYQVNEDYTSAHECLISMKALVQKESIYSDNRIGTVLLNLANNFLHLSEFDKSIEHCTEARKYFPNNIFNQSLVDEYMFYSNFYRGKYYEAFIYINKLISLPKENISAFSISKWIYLSANLDFVNKKFTECLSKLESIPEIDKDKEGWNINKRILIILCRIELQQYESVDLQVFSLEKFIKRSLKKRDISLRYLFILKILIKLINSNYNYYELLRRKNKYLELFYSNDERVGWKIKSPELVNFENWFLNRSKIIFKK